MLDLARHQPLMAKERTTRAEPVTLEELRGVRERLQVSLDNLDELIEKMERAKLSDIMLRWKTRRDAANDWFIFSKQLDATFESELLRVSAEKSGQIAKEKDRKFRDR